MKFDERSPSLFIKNRYKLQQLLLPGSVIILPAGKRIIRNGDQHYPYRESSDFYYLAGISHEGAVIVLAPGLPEPKLREVLFLPVPDEKILRWEGSGYTPGKAAKASGIDNVQYMDALESHLRRVMEWAEHVYLNHPDTPGKIEGEPFADGSLEKKIITAFPPRELHRLSPLMMRTRMLKEPAEIDRIRKAIRITRTAFLAVLDQLKPGMYEYEVEALITYEFIRHGAEGHAFEPIVGSGQNALVLHYVKNNDLCREGDLLLMDFGAEWGHYCADCSRTVPVNGRYTDRQRELYDATLRVFRKARQLMQPGTLMGDFHAAVGKLWEEEHVKLGLYSMQDLKKQPPSSPLWQNYYWHGTSHSMGLDVHDPFDRSVPFREGMVFSCEPGIYIPEEGVAIRLENDVLITSDGPEDLMEDIPMDPGEMEERLNRS